MADTEMGNTAVDAGAITNSQPKPEKLPITVEKPTPYTFDLGHLLVNDPNPLTYQPGESINASLKATARDGTQSLINQLLTTCSINSTAQGVFLNLPSTTTALPRHKPLPTPKPPTKWELFARRKGIGRFSTKPGAALAEKERKSKIVFDEAKGEWVPKWGYKGKNKADQDAPIVEVNEKDTKKEEDAAAEGSSIRGLSRAERKEKVKRNERKMRANDRRARKMGS